MTKARVLAHRALFAARAFAIVAGAEACVRTDASSTPARENAPPTPKHAEAAFGLGAPAPAGPSIFSPESAGARNMSRQADATPAHEAPRIAVRRPGAFANLDPTDDYVVGPPEPYDGCEEELKRAGITARAASLPVHKPRGAKNVCGSPQVVTYVRGPGGIAYNAPPLLTCTMALALASFERILQEEAETMYGSRVARIEQLGTYSCREIAAYPGWVSEHSYANAIDIASFVLKNGKRLDVLRDFDVSRGAPTKPAGAFLRSITRRANDEDVFSHVLTPFFNAHHRNHFHLDLARYRTDGTRPQTEAAP